LFPVNVSGQPVLLPSIGVNGLPADNDSVCLVPWYLGSFYSSGLQIADTAYEFKLYDISGDSMLLSSALSSNKPVLLIAGSYTCPVFRQKIPVINDLASIYAGLINIYIIYTLEAHPYLDTSVYFGYVNTTTANIQEGILYEQPKTYGERKAVVADMLSDLSIQAPVYLDGPCNNWWNTYGPAPNNAYLIDTNGVVISKHGWFHKFPDNIYCDLDSLLGTNSGNCNITGGNGTFTFQLTSNDTVFDFPGATLSVDGLLQNNSQQDLIIYARKIENDMPQGWASSMCLDVCYSTSTDSVLFILPASTILPVHIYYYSSITAPDTGYVKMGFRNMNNWPNHDFVNGYAVTTVSTGIENTNNPALFNIYPNPTTEEISIETSSIPDEIILYDIAGKQLNRYPGISKLKVAWLKPGIYFLSIKSDDTFIIKKFVKQ